MESFDAITMQSYLAGPGMDPAMSLSNVTVSDNLAMPMLPLDSMDHHSHHSNYDAETYAG
jgi:hypothetical protein